MESILEGPVKIRTSLMLVGWLGFGPGKILLYLQRNSAKGKQFEEHWQKQKITDFGQMSVILCIISQTEA